jgi:hypothetical protein
MVTKFFIITLIIFSLLISVPINQYASAQVLPISSVLPSPTNLVANAASSSQINLSWNAPIVVGKIVTDYKIERSINGGTTWNIIASKTGTTFSDTGLTPSTTYTYRVSAIYQVGTSPPSNTASATTDAQSAGITVYAHRIPAAYWDPCFATTCSAGSGPGATMYFELWDSLGNLVQSGYADEGGYTFSGLTAGTTYYVYPFDCNSCHGSNHNVVFQYWGDNQSTVKPRPATEGASLNAWYSCTNSCADGP